MPAGSLMNLVHAESKRGFTVDEGGAIVPLNAEAEYLYRLGLDTRAKFFENEQTEQQIVAEALGFEYARDRYVVVLHDEASPRGVPGTSMVSASEVQLQALALIGLCAQPPVVFISYSLAMH